MTPRFLGNATKMGPAQDRTPARSLAAEGVAIDERIREGRFQRLLALIAGLSSILSGLEVAYEHYRGSYSSRIMYTPVVLSGALLGAGVWGFRNERAARTVLPAVSAATLLDGAIGFCLHVRGIHRKPGGWRLPIVNLVMGPPVFAPLLFGVSAYLGLVASFLRREGHPDEAHLPGGAHPRSWIRHVPGKERHERISWEQDLREGRFQRHMAVATALAAAFSGAEAWYSHYENNFRYAAQWTPIVIAPMLAAAGLGAVTSRRVAHTWLPLASALAVADGAVGCYYHARGVLRRPGGARILPYNIVYGPPIFAPLLFAASGFLGLLASLLRREDRA
jgi:hypothetical protein